MSFRYLTLHAESVVQILTDLGAGKEIRICGHGIPPGAVIAGVAVSNDEDHAVTITLVHHRWPDNLPAGTPLTLMYAVRHGHSGTEGDWGAPQSIGPDDA